MLKIISLRKIFPLEKDFFGRIKKKISAVNDITIELPDRCITGIVGESGSGKSTLARLLTGIYKPDDGSFEWDGFNSKKMKAADWKKYRRKVQMVFQDPYSSLNPRMKVGDILAEPSIIHKEHKKNDPQLRELISDALTRVGLSGEAIQKYPHEFSGGQRQRIAIARALILNPDMVIFDEAVSALDVSIQAQILNLVLDIQKSREMTCLFIAHDLSVVSYVADYIAVMYGGRVVEFNNTEAVFKSPKHPYTKLLLESIPEIGAKLKPGKNITQETIFINQDGCPFYYRCPSKIDVCLKNYPEKTIIDKDNYFECFNP